MNKRILKGVIPSAIVLIISGMTILLWLLPLFHTLEHKTIDWRIRFRVPDRSFGERVLVVLLDEPLMEQLPYRSPVPRGMLAKLVRIINDSGAKLIALDVFLKNLTWEEEDKKLSQALQASGRVVLVSALREEDGRFRLDMPHENFLDAALATGLADFPINPMDQRVRELQAYYRVEDKIVPALATALFLLHRGAEIMPSKQVNMNTFEEKWPRVQLDRDHRLFINYQGPPSTVGEEENIIRTLPASAVITGLVPKEWFKDRIVLVGAGYADNSDAYRTPFYSSRFDYTLTPGVEIHANALATIFEGKTITPFPLTLTFLTVLIFSVMLMLMEMRFNTLISGIALTIICAGHLIISFIVFEKTNMALPVVPVFMGVILTFIFLTVYRSLTEGRQKRWIKNAFQMYLSPEFVNILLKKPDLLFLGGEERELTILFSDLQGFTSLSEGMTPKDLVTLLNEYLDGMTRILLDHGGTLDKYEGDAIMAFWGAPLEQPDHAKRAVHAALEMSRFSEDLNRRFQDQGRPSLKTRIGLNTGKAVVGNIGSEKRFNYTIIGDEVNLASRLEGANKQYGTYLMISHSTYVLVKDLFLTRELDNLRVKGKERPVKVYEVLGPLGDGNASDLMEMLECYNRGLSAYGKRRWEEALGLFEKALGVKSGDGPSLTYVDRCRYFINNPPNEDWDGVFSLQTK